jgi:hypothetical protein
MFCGCQPAIAAYGASWPEETGREITLPENFARMDRLVFAAFCFCAKKAAGKFAARHEKCLGAEIFLRLLFAVPLKRDNVESGWRSRACSLTFCRGKGGRETKAEGQAVTMQWNLDAKTQKRRGAGSGGEVGLLIRASPFGEPEWHGQDSLCVLAVLFPRIAHFWQNFPKRLAE